jgi:A/G-specific adenine glycosylase
LRSLSKEPESPVSQPTKEAVQHFRQSVLVWFDAHGRKNLPWQVPRDPYRVWISEIMLQQTQVATVLPYFERFTASFPDVPALASAPAESVLALWSGLGYYARARNLHRCAETLVEHHGGALPATLGELSALPGIGRSTAGAILSLGFGMRATILDGNVKRVLCRYWGIEGWPGIASVAATLWATADRLTPPNRSDAYNQAMMDLGALVCTRGRPDCDHCPLSPGCRARAEQRVGLLPSPRPRRAVPVRRYTMLLLEDGAGNIFLERRPPTGVWGGLWCFPMFDDASQIAAWLAMKSLRAEHLADLPAQRHTLTHFHLDFVAVRMQATRPPDRVSEAHSCWTSPNHASDLGLPAPVRRLLDQFNPYHLGAAGT